jgi:hypothetical protein
MSALYQAGCGGGNLPAARVGSAPAAIARAPLEPLDEALETIDRRLGACGGGLGTLGRRFRTRCGILGPTRGGVVRPTGAGEDRDDEGSERGPAHPGTVGVGPHGVKCPGE